MAVPFHVTTVEECHISPSPDSIIPRIALPLTFLDIPWLLYPSNQTLLFFPRPPPKTTITTVITLLRQSLSLTLHHFHPLAGNLSAAPPPTPDPYIVYTKGDSVSFIIAESNTTINHLSGHHPRRINDLHSLLPKLIPRTCSSRDTHVVQVIPLLAIQITVFTDFGFSIGVTSQHATADERTLDQFIKSWASICKSLSKKESCFACNSTPTPTPTPTPWFDRTVLISDPNSLKSTFLEQWWNRLNCPKEYSHKAVDDNIVQSTFLMSPSDMNMIKQHILSKCKIVNQDPPVHLSPYVTACSYLWICLLKVQEEAIDSKDGDHVYFGFNAGGITRLGYEIPSSYFGNCIAFGRCKAKKSEMLGDDGIVFAAKSLGKEIKRLDNDVLGGAERWICDWDELNIRVLGSPKVDSYGIDFGWGKVEKFEKISSDHHDHATVHVVSLTGSKDVKGGIEMGVVLTVEKMSAFSDVFKEGLVELCMKKNH